MDTKELSAICKVALKVGLELECDVISEAPILFSASVIILTFALFGLSYWFVLANYKSRIVLLEGRLGALSEDQEVEPPSGPKMTESGTVDLREGAPLRVTTPDFPENPQVELSGEGSDGVEIQGLTPSGFFLVRKSGGPSTIRITWTANEE